MSVNAVPIELADLQVCLLVKGEEKDVGLFITIEEDTARFVLPSALARELAKALLGAAEMAEDVGNVH